MVLQKRLSYRSSASTAYQVTATPYIPSSAKGKRSARKKVEENQMCAIDLLATVAGQLLEVEGENFSTPTIGFGASSSKQCVKQEQPNSRKLVKVEAYDGTNFSSKEHSKNPNTVSRHASVLFNSNASDKDCSVRKPVISLGRSKESWECKAEDGITTPRRAERMSGNLMDTEPPRDCSFEDPMDMDSKPPALVSSDSSVEVQLCRDRIGHSSSFDNHDTGTKLALSRDDDENSSGCTHPDNSRALKPQRIGDRRIKKLLASKFLEVASTMFKDAELSDTERKPVLRGSKLCYTRQRTQRCTFKRRKLFERYTVSPSSRDLCGEGTSNSTIKSSIKVEPSISQSKLHGETGAFSSSSGNDPSHESGDLQVKFSIKSFKVPELFFDMHKTATVDSLKRTVMEAVTAALGGGLCVGVYVQGEKVWDDSKTLLQAGISHANELDDLDFTLESNPNQALPRLPEDFLPPCDSTAPLTRIPAAVPPSDQGASSGSMLEPPMPQPAVNCPESDHDSVHSLTDDSNPEKVATNSKAMVPVPAPAERVEPLATVPLLRKARRLDLVQRRIRRPFSVTEVEALVQAVEKLGTGRWRDVKIRAFDNSKHRTYVDLKDKWKTLVHTAKISPQQRRGAPVPQDLLDRVLTAHAYWTNHQVKPATEPTLLLI